MESLEADFRSFADMGVEAVELELTTLDLVVGGRVVPERAERLIALTRKFDFRYTVHRVVSSNLTDPAVYRYQIDAAKALNASAMRCSSLPSSASPMGAHRLREPLRHGTWSVPAEPG